MHEPAFITAVTAILCGCLAGCSGQGSKTRSADTVSVSDSALTVDETLKPLPDTVYESVRALSYRIDTVDKSISPKLSSLADMYATAPGTFTFRKTAFRDAAYDGRVKGRPSRITVDWTFPTPMDNRETKFGIWGGGTGWTGQPLYVEWPDSCVRKFRKAPCSGLTADFGPKEIIVGTLASQILFINYETGKASRAPLPSGNPIKGTMSLDPSLNGNLYFGQGVPNERPFGARTVDLYRHTVTHSQNEDPRALRRWDAYDSSPLRVGQFLFRPGENGIIYKFLVEPGRLRLQSTLNYSVNGVAPGIESSMAAYLNYGYTCDNHGNIVCFNLETMRPVWRHSLGDDTDASPALVMEGGRPCLYVGCEVDRNPEGASTFVKLDGLTGKRLWEHKTEGTRFELDGKHFDGGYYASALPGAGNCDAYVFVNVVRNADDRRNGSFVAYERATGKVAYSVPLKYYAWSSPVGFLNEKNEMFVVTGDCAGFIYIIDGRTGEIINSKRVGHNFESTPVVIGNTLVVGSRGQEIYRISIS